MAIISGLILLALAICLAVFWSEAVLMVLQGALVIALFLAGFVTTMVGYSRKKAEREYARATSSHEMDEAGT